MKQDEVENNSLSSAASNNQNPTQPAPSANHTNTPHPNPAAVPSNPIPSGSGTTSFNTGSAQTSAANNTTPQGVVNSTTPSQVNSNPASAAPNPSASSSGKPEFNFNSAAIGVKTARKQDVFAEHKRKAAEHKAKQQKKLKLSLIIGGIALVIIAAIITIILLVMKPWDKVVEEDTPVVDPVEVEENNKLYQEIYNAAKNEENEENAEQFLEESINKAKNTKDANIARVSQMKYFNDKGDYDKVIEIGNESNVEEGSDDEMTVCNSNDLGLDLLITCNNIMVSAHYSLDQHDEADRYRERLTQLQNEKINLERQ